MSDSIKNIVLIGNANNMSFLKEKADYLHKELGVNVVIKRIDWNEVYSYLPNPIEKENWDLPGIKPVKAYVSDKIAAMFCRYGLSVPLVDVVS